MGWELESLLGLGTNITRDGLLVLVVEGTQSHGDEQAGRLLEMPREAL